MSSITFRPVAMEEAPLLLELIRALEKEEGFPYPAPVTEVALRQNLLPDGGPGLARFIISDREIAGYFVLYFTFSTATGCKGLHLDDLYILESFRGRGLGLEAMRELARIAIEEDCARMEWWAMRWNRTATGFYRSMNVTTLDDVAMYRMEGEEILRLAGK